MISSLFPNLVSGSSRVGLRYLQSNEGDSAAHARTGDTEPNGSTDGSNLESKCAASGLAEIGGSTSSSPDDRAKELESRLAEKDALIVELQKVHKSLGARLLKLDEGLRSKDLQLAELARRYEEAQRSSEAWRRRAEEAEEEMAVLRHALVTTSKQSEGPASKQSEGIAAGRPVPPQLSASST
eukprot:TRINITY_DN113488_c0_g1_i1.p1 TRINITY_DN113488_c0_g1~~TRINITY_DN113488_c0_g1_i1.p1  ORF type:complete len:183 (-),score=47.27 TRINITY_DN113488_c0_g1_i1:25-573(-)